MNDVLIPPADVLLTDGTIATIRPARSEDRDDLLELHEDVSDDARRLRFFTASRQAGRDYVIHLMSGGRSGPLVSLVATVRGRIVGLATAEPVTEHAAEVAFLISDPMHGRGIGTLLLEHLANACRVQGVRRLIAEVMPENAAMLRVFHDAGFETSFHGKHTVVEIQLSTTATARARDASDGRDIQAEARSLTPLLYPRCVAVVGVRRDGWGVGAEILRSIAQGGFTGETFVVHPTESTLLGTPCYATLTRAPKQVDLAIVTVPAAQVPAVLEDAVNAQVSAAVVVSSGFAELDAAGGDLQRQITRIARENSMRLVGPNCLGVLCNDPEVRLNATFALTAPRGGGLAVASQSGGVGIALLDLARQQDLGVHSFVSLGNKADVSSNDLLAAWCEDDRVEAAALYLESFGNPAKFARLARRFAERKPLIAVVGGRSSGGVRGGVSHTAAAAAPFVGVRALFAQAGVIACHSAEEMARTALLLDRSSLPDGRRVAVLTNAGGLGVLAADAAADLALSVPAFSEALRSRLAESITSTVGTGNPVDLGAGADPSKLASVLELVLTSGEVDAVLVVLVKTVLMDGESVAYCLRKTREAHPDALVMLVASGDLGRAHVDPGFASFRSAEEALQALAHAAWYAEWRSDEHDVGGVPNQPRAAEARARAKDLLSGSTPPGRWLAPDACAALLAPYGLDPVGTVVAGATAAADAAEAIGFPVAVKVADPAVVHKTDGGLVRVGLQDRDQVRDAVDWFNDSMGRDDVPVLVQPLAAGVEMALGVVRDPWFGPLVMVAAGGVGTDVWQDRTFLLPPFGRRDAARAVRSLRVWPMLDGFRGAPRTDAAALEKAICALGELSTDVPEIAELDLNPVIATPDGVCCVDIKVRLQRPRGSGGELPRQLRPQVGPRPVTS